MSTYSVGFAGQAVAEAAYLAASQMTVSLAKNIIADPPIQLFFAAK